MHAQQKSHRFDTSLMGNAATAKSFGTRRAVHADDLWYHSDEDLLTEHIQGFLNRSQADHHNASAKAFPVMKPFDETDEECHQKKIRALIVPHGPIKSNASSTAAAAYQYCNPMTLRGVKSIILLYPSHHMGTQGACQGRCAITGADYLETPVATLQVHAELRSRLLSVAPDKFDILPKDLDESEHAAEVHLPWIAHVLRTANLLEDVFVTPIMVGSMTTADEISLAIKLRPILQLEELLTIVTTNLCYWDSVVGYQPMDARQTVPNFLATQDRQLLTMIENKDVAGLAAFWLRTDYTTCGKSAIAIWLRCVSRAPIKIQLCSYDQSASIVQSMQDSCITYASLIANAAEFDE